MSKLEELYLSHNGITRIEGLDKLVGTGIDSGILYFLSLLQVSLKILDLSSNRLQHLENLEQLTSLEEFWVSQYILLLPKLDIHPIIPVQ